MTEPPEPVQGLVPQPLRHGVDHRVEPYHPIRVRATLAYYMLALLAATLAFVALQVARGYWDQTREFTEILLPAELALIGSATAFYFASAQEK